MGGNCPELFEGSGRVLASGLGKFDIDLVTGTFGPPTEALTGFCAWHKSYFRLF
jgi:hypothetical protein